MTSAVKERTNNLALGKLRFNFPNWGDDMNGNMDIIDAAFATFGIIISGTWDNGTAYIIGALVVDPLENLIYRCLVSHTSAALPTTFAQDRAAHPTYWGTYNSSVTYRGAWTTATQYYANETFTYNQGWYIVTTSHISGVFATDLSNGLFSVLFDPSATNALLSECYMNGMITGPQSSESYIVALKMRHAGTISQTTMKSESGTVTATWKVNSTTIGQGNHSVTSTEASITRTSNNTFVAGDDIIIEFASASGAYKVYWSFEYSQTS